MENIILFAALSGVLLAASADAVKLRRLTNLSCYPRPSVVQTKPMFYPYFVSLHRCNGSNDNSPPHKFKCVPKKTETVRVLLYNGVDVDFLTMKNHTECETQCIIKREDCQPPSVYDPSRCTCSCPYSSPPKGSAPCGSKKLWDRVRCRCRCKLEEKCQEGHVFDEETCSCKRKPELKSLCKSTNGICTPQTSGNRKPQLQSSLGEDDAGSFVGSTAFWLYILIGEFVLLAICFDVILYCKQMGVTYRITRSCKRETSRADEEEPRADGEPQVLKAHYNDACDSAFSSLHNITICSIASEATKFRL